MGDFKQPINNNGYMRDIYQTTRNEYIETNEPMIFNNKRSYSLKGIIQETPMSNLFFSDVNVNAIQMTIRYRIFTEKKKTIGYQSEKELFAVMRSIYLQHANSVITSDKMIGIFDPAIENITSLNEKVVTYSVENISVQIDQHDEYLVKISSAPVHMDHPRAGNTDSYTYDMSNIIF
jgi:hypothetical protein